MDKNVRMVDELMNSIIQTDDWDEIQLNDPWILEQNSKLDTALDRLKDAAPPELADLIADLEDATLDAAYSYITPAILYGIHVADAIRDVAARPCDLSRYVMNRAGGITA